MRRASKVLATVAVILAGMPITAHAEATATRLTAGEVIETWNDDQERGVVGFEVYGGAMRATLTDVDGNPLADKSITFQVYPSGGCSAVTDAAGVARCGQSRGGYGATFAGDETYARSYAEGCLVTMSGRAHGCVFGGETLLDLGIR